MKVEKQTKKSNAVNILDIGCGKSKYPKSIGIDNNKKSDADIIFNVELGIPFPANQFDMVYSNHSLEHLEPKKLVYVLEEIWRVTKPNGKILIRLPHFSGVAAFANPTHLRGGFSIQTFAYFNSQNEYSKYGKIGFKTQKIQLRKLGTPSRLWSFAASIITYFANVNPMFCELFWVYWFGGFDEIEFQLQPIK